MRWRFWRKDAELFDAPLVAPATTTRPGAAEPADDDNGPVATAASRAVPGGELPDLPNGPVAAPDLPATDADSVAEVVRLVRRLVAEQPAGQPGARPDSLRPDSLREPAAAVAVAVAALAVRLPSLAGVTGSPEEDPDARSLLLAYAGLLAGRAEPLRRRSAPDLSKDLLPAVAREACGEPGPTQHPGDRLRAACVLLAQTCADGGAGPDAIPGELERARRP